MACKTEGQSGTRPAGTVPAGGVRARAGAQDKGTRFWVRGAIPQAAFGILLGLMANGGGSVVAASEGVVDPFAVVATLDRFAEKPIWPGFEPTKYPLAIYDGERTLLFRHPSPPKEFTLVEGQEQVWASAQRLDSMSWNGVIDLGGVQTAALVLTLEPGREVTFEASILLHEVFHLFSKPRHPTWRPNEMHRYSYPVADLENHTLLLLEGEALARALEAEENGMAVRWAATALQWRRQRTRPLAKEHLAFETAQEMQEGTAVHVARLALGTPRDTTRLREPRTPEKFRWRFYDTGAALAAMLDAVDPSWKRRLEAEPAISMATLLEEALERKGVVPAKLSTSDTATIRATAHQAVTELKARRAALRKDFLSRSPRLVVTVPPGAAPLRLRGFDPLALEILDNGEALHSHRFTLKGATGQVEVENPSFQRQRSHRHSFEGIGALTVPAGAHPFLDGVREVTISGFAEKLSVSRQGTVLTIETEGLRLSFEDAVARTVGEELRVLLRPQESSGD
ncbi:MAG: hypothetical protein K0U98_10630 [Deltaproteobacteria bacterium]|nr:hypothetical protein [Deltaproteobacteria bacterium]